MVFVADDLGAWLIGLLADAGRRKLTVLVLGSDQKRALRKAAVDAVQDTAAEMNLPDEQATRLVTLIGEAFRRPVQGALLAGSVTMMEVLQAGIARQLAVLDAAGSADGGQSPQVVLALPGGALAEKLTSHLVREIMLRGCGGGPLTPLADQLNHDLTHLQGQRVEGMLARLVARTAASVSSPDPASAFEDVGLGLRAGPVRVSEADPRRLGVHAAIVVPGVPEEVPPEYVPRDVDAAEHGVRVRVAAAAQRGGFILLVGGSSVGKTRCAVEAVKAVLPDWWLVHPAGPAEVVGLAHAPSNRLVVWLDELQRYLDGAQGLTGAVVRALLNGPHAVVIIGTLWPDRYAAYTVMPASGAADGHAREREVLDLAGIVRVGPAFSPAEQERARAAGARDQRLAIALKSAGYGLTQTLAAAPLLVARWEDAQSASPYAGAVLTAALDAARLGARAPLSSDFLCAAAPGYCTSQQQAEAPEDWFEQAVAFATGKLHGAAAALNPAGVGMGQVAGYTAADYLIQHASRERRRVRVPASTWDAFLGHIRDPGDAARLADSAGERFLYRYAIPLYSRAADAGSTGAMYSLGFLLQEQGKAQQAERWYRRAAEAGHFGAMSNLAVLLRERGHAEQAEHWYSKASAGGQIVYPKPRKREPGEAELLHREAAAGSPSAMLGLGNLLVEQGNAEQAERWYRKAADAREVDAMSRLAELYDEDGHPDLAEQWYRMAADTGDSGAMSNLGIFLAAHGQPDLAEQCYRKAIASGGPVAAGAMYNLGGLLEDQRQADQAEHWYRNSAALGHSAAMTSLGSLLASRGNTEQAEHWYRKAIAAGDTNAMRKLRDLGDISK
jgi:TPR repeat protein